MKKEWTVRKIVREKIGKIQWLERNVRREKHTTIYLQYVFRITYKVYIAIGKTTIDVESRPIRNLLAYAISTNVYNLFRLTVIFSTYATLFKLALQLHALPDRTTLLNIK